MPQTTLQPPPPTSEGPPVAPLPKVKKPRRWLPWAAGLIAFLLGVGIGASGGEARPTQADLDEARAEISELRADNGDLQAENTDLMGEMTDSRSRIARLEDRLAENQAAKGTIATLREQVASLKDQLAEARGASAESEQSPASQASSPASGQTLTGNGSKTVTITTSGGTLSWTNDGGLFQLWNDSMSVFVNSQGSSGTTEVPAGTFELTVNAMGNWTIRLP